jgi:leader peptidase (prepilin peptidase)/N-methyltransferase
VTALVVVASVLAGFTVGSFLNVVVYRVPRKESVVTPRSHCPECSSPVTVRDNVPVLSWILLRGRCRACGEPISWRYPAVEVLTAALFLATAIRFGPHAEVAAYLVFFAGLVALAAVDLDQMILPRTIIYWTLALGAPLLVIASAVDGDWRRCVDALLGGALAFAALFVVHVIAPRGMGFGDVRLAGLIGVFVGWLGLAQVAIALFLGFLVGSVVGMALIALGRKGRRSRLPFGPFLATGAVLAVLFGSSIQRLWLG